MIGKDSCFTDLEQQFSIVASSWFFLFYGRSVSPNPPWLDAPEFDFQFTVDSPKLA